MQLASDHVEQPVCQPHKLMPPFRPSSCARLPRVAWGNHATQSNEKQVNKKKKLKEVYIVSHKSVRRLMAFFL